MWNHASKGLGDAFILGSTQGSSELRHGLNFGEAEHCLRCCAGTSSPLSSVLDESGGFESQCLDAFCGHTGLMDVARGLAGLQESLSDCKKPQEGTVLCLFFKFYTHTRVCVYFYVLRNCLVFALYLWQKHNYFIFCPSCAP